MESIQKQLLIDHSENGFKVTINNHMIGQSIISFIVAYNLAKKYEKLYQLDISITKQALKNIQVKQDFEVIAEEMGLPKAIFHDLADQLEKYRDNCDQNKSFQSFIEWIKISRQSFRINHKSTAIAIREESKETFQLKDNSEN